MTDPKEILKNKFFQNTFFVEEIDAKKLEAIINCDAALNHDEKWWDDTDIRDEFNEKICNEKAHLQLILDKCIKNDKTGKMEIDVHYASKSNYGRVYPIEMLSLGILRRPVRHFVCEDIYYDIDMINAHYFIATGLCEMWDIKCESSKAYCNHRDKMIIQCMSNFSMKKDEAKKMFIALLNGGGWRYHVKNRNSINENSALVQYLDGLKVETSEICNKFIKKAPPGLYDELTKHKTLKRDKKRTFIAKFLQIYEEKVLKVFFGLLQEKSLIHLGRARCVLCHDGAMVEKRLFKESKVNIDNFINELNDVIEEEVGFQVKFKVKAFDEADETRNILLREKKDFTSEYIDPFVNKYGVWRNDEIASDDNTLANLFYHSKKLSFVNCHNKLYYKTKYGVYNLTTTQGLRNAYQSHIKDFADFQEKKSKPKNELYGEMLKKKFLYCESDKEKRPILLADFKILSKLLKSADNLLNANNSSILQKLKNNKGQQDIVKVLIPMYNDDEFRDKLDIDPNLLGFNNGVLDLRDENLDTVRNTKEGEYVSMSCGYDFYIDEKAKKCCDECYSKIREMVPTKEIADFLLIFLCKILRGNNNIEELAMFLKGVGANGKGLLFYLIHLCLGDYSYVLSYKHFTYLKQDNRSVELFESAKKRIITVAEIPKKMVWNADTFQSWTGRDPINVRNNYSTKMTEIVPNTTFTQANGFIQFDSYTCANSLKRRIVAIEMPYEFKREAELDPNNPLHKLRDDTLKDKFKQDDYKRGFMLLLIQFYKKYRKEGLGEIPEEIKKYTEEYIKNLSPNKEWFDNNLKHDSVNGHSIRVKDLLKEFRDDTKNTWKLKYFQEKLEEYGYTLGCGKAVNMFNPDVRVGGNSSKIVKNVRYVGADCDSDSDSEVEEKKEDEKMHGESKKVELAQSSVMTFTTSDGKIGKMEIKKL